MKGKKKILLAVALVLVMAVGITSIVVIRNRNKTVVKVFPVSMLNSSDWFDTDTSLTGTLTSDYIQEVHIDGGQKVKKVYVKKGDKVKKGDILLKYNVSEKELDLKLQKLQIQSSKMEIAEMEKELKKLKNTKTVGAVNTGNSDVMNASVNLSAIKGTSLSYLVAEANGNTEGTSSDVKVQSGNAVSKSGSGSGSESGSGSGSGSESGSGSGSGSESGSGSGSGSESGSGSGSGSESGSGSGSGSESGSGSGSGSESGSGSGETKLVLRDHVNSEADKAATSGAGTKEDDSLIFTLTKNGTISGAFVKKLISEGKYAEFRSYKSEESKNPIATFELSPDTKVNVYDNDNYTVNKLNEGGDSRTLHNSIESVSERDSSSGDGSSAGNAYIYYLNVNGRVKGSVIKSLHDSKKYATFIEFDENGKEKNRYEYNPDRVFTDLEEDGLYKVSDFDNLTIRPAYKDLKADKLEDGQKDSNGKYIFYLQKGGKISGSLLNDLIKKGINAEFIEYASEKDYDNENTENANTLEITSSSKFTVELADGTGYTISYLKSKVKKDDPSKPTTEHENPTTPSTDKKIKFKQNRKRVTAVKGADTGDDGDDNNGGGSDDGSGSGSGDGIDDGTDSSGGDDNGYTAEELKAAISDKEDDIAQAKEDLHDAQISYKEAKAEVDKATVKAKLAGTVTTAYSKGTLPTDGSAAIVVKAADGMYVKTSISEMELDSVKVGGTIKCVSSDTGDEYTAEVKEISDFPTADSSNGGDVSNPNSSYYPIVAFIKDADGLSPGGSVEVSYSSKSMGTANENAVYLQKAYIRTEDKKSYVYLRDKKTKRLKKQYITIGKTMNGQYIEIVSGVTEDDNIAFPYGKNLREGVKTKISEDDSEMIY
ncbi:MAG: efflux RND transporter periplasmic adaptor subunit [Anaerobutyricum hallii]|uniref:efflux RND transporter periplasmic adaptor subunit n=1 Tax=Anaerobutyricum hallii TaxID=39488 RepID=UPI00399059B8